MRRNKLEAVQWCHPLALARLAWATFIVLVLILLPQMAQASELLMNGNFATGDLSGWSTAATGAGTWTSYNSATGGLPAPSGSAAVTDLDSTDSGAHVLYQAFVVPSGATSVTLSFDMFLWSPNGIAFQDAYTLDNYSYHQEAWVDILPLGGNPLSAMSLVSLYQTPNGGTSSTTPSGFVPSGSIDITRFLTPGETYLLRFAEVNNNKSGPLYWGLDNVSVNAITGTSGGSGGTGDIGGGATETPEPGTLLLIGSGCVAFGLWRRKAKVAAATA